MPAVSRSAHVRVRTVLAAAGIAAGTVLTATTATHVALSAAEHPVTTAVTRPAADRAVAERLAAAGVTATTTASAGEASRTPTVQRPASAEASRGAARHRPAKRRRHVVRRHRTQRVHHRTRHHATRHHRVAARHHVGSHHHAARHPVARRDRVARHHAVRHHTVARHHALRLHRLAQHHHVTHHRPARHLSRAQMINRVIAVARAQRGKPYVWGASGPHAFDCSGYVQWVYRRALGVRLPKYTDTQYRATRHLHSIGQLRRGDLVFVRVGRHEEHVGIYAGHWRWWVAPHTGSRVRLQRIYPARHVYSRVIP